jgi:hypothetical protein
VALAVTGKRCERTVLAGKRIVVGKPGFDQLAPIHPVGRRNIFDKARARLLQGRQFTVHIIMGD